MVVVITGTIDSGKTTHILAIYRSLKQGNGIIAIKEMKGKDVYGYLCHELKTGKEFPYMIHEKQITNESDFISQIGPYHVYRNAQEHIDSIYKQEIEKKNSPLFFDEVGKLELSGAGYDKSLRLALQEGLDVYITCREDLVEEIMNYYGITEYTIKRR